jgi:death-on-curing protein
MTRYLTLEEVLDLQRQIIAETGGRPGVLDRGRVESCVAQPQMTFGGQELYPSLAEKAACIGYLLVTNHAFADGNKRAGYVAMRVFLLLNGQDLSGSQDEKEAVMLAVAAHQMSQEDFFAWVREHIHENREE